MCFENGEVNILSKLKRGIVFDQSHTKSLHMEELEHNLIYYYVS